MDNTDRDLRRPKKVRWLSARILIKKGTTGLKKGGKNLP